MMGSGIPKVLKRVEERGEVEFEKGGGVEREKMF
jgi:hypothetical protein